MKHDALTKSDLRGGEAPPTHPVEAKYVESRRRNLLRYSSKSASRIPHLWRKIPHLWGRAYLNRFKEGVDYVDLTQRLREAETLGRLVSDRGRMFRYSPQWL